MTSYGTVTQEPNIYSFSRVDTGKNLKRSRRTSGVIALCCIVTATLILFFNLRELEDTDLKKSSLQEGVIDDDAISDNCGNTWDKLQHPCISKSMKLRLQNADQESNALNDVLLLEVTNEYKPLNSLEFYPWKYIVEPVRSTTLSVSGFKGKNQLHWRLHYDDNGTRVEALNGIKNDTVEYAFPSAGKTYYLQVDDLHSGRSLSEVLMCKYVRRELRQLSADDRNAFFGCLSAFFRLTDSEALKTYGEGFETYAQLTKKHLSQPTFLKCSPYHGGWSFFTAHAAFSQSLEKSLQVLDPSISLPYWDYSIDGEVLGKNWDRSPIFSPQWFGHASFNMNKDHVMNSGTFANISIPGPNEKGDDIWPERNAFGMLTHVYNTNPVAYVTRTNEICGLPTKLKLPDCVQMKAMLRAPGLQALYETSGFVHGYIHMMIGGAWDCSVSFADLFQERPDLLLSHGKFFEGVAAFSNILWYIQQINDILKCPAECSPDVDYHSCTCTCPTMDMQNMTYTEAYKYMHVFLTLLEYYPFTREFLHSDTEFGYVKISNLTESDQHFVMKWLVKYSCHPGKLSAFSSPFAAPNDPLFYPLHNYYERVWAFRRHTTQGGPWNDSWGEGYDTSLGFGSYCQGFGYHDTLPFSAENIKDDQSSHLYTNAELYDYYDPHNPDLPYVWDDFEWAHCPSNLLEDEDPTGIDPSSAAPPPI